MKAEFWDLLIYGVHFVFTFNPKREIVTANER